MQGSFGGKHIFTHNILLFVLLWYHHMPVHQGLLCTSLLWHTWLQPFIFFYQSNEAMVHAAVICLLVCTFLSQTRETRHLVNHSPCVNGSFVSLTYFILFLFCQLPFPEIGTTYVNTVLFTRSFHTLCAESLTLHLQASAVSQQQHFVPFASCAFSRGKI